MLEDHGAGVGRAPMPHQRMWVRWVPLAMSRRCRIGFATSVSNTSLGVNGDINHVLSSARIRFQFEDVSSDFFCPVSTNMISNDGSVSEGG